VSTPFITFDGKTLYFAANFDGNMDIYKASKNGEEWGSPEKVENVSSGDYEGYPSLSADGRRLYFMRKASGESNSDAASTDDKSGEGKKGGAEVVSCYKLMVSKMMKDGKWGAPEELPSPLNDDCNKAPHIGADGETMYFSSMRKGAVKGMKVDAVDFNLFMSRLEGDSWQAPKPMDFANHLSAETGMSVAPMDGPTTIMYFNVDMNSIGHLFRRHSLRAKF
jgi:hypothetical protein